MEDRNPNTWILRNTNYKANPSQAYQYCVMLQMSFPHLDIIYGVVFYTMNDTLLLQDKTKVKDNFPGKHFWCQDGDRIYDPCRDWFDVVHSYKKMKIKKAGK